MDRRRKSRFVFAMAIARAAGVGRAVTSRTDCAIYGDVMKIHSFAAILAVIGLAAPASAQTVPDDVRCLLLSNATSKVASDDRAKAIASEALLFFVGRVDGRASDPVIINTMREQVPTIDPKKAGTEMNACVARVQSSKQRMQRLGQSAQAGQGQRR